MTHRPKVSGIYTCLRRESEFVSPAYTRINRWIVFSSKGNIGENEFGGIE
jgi:hypothetical protein